MLMTFNNNNNNLRHYDNITSQHTDFLFIARMLSLYVTLTEKFYKF